MTVKFVYLCNLDSFDMDIALLSKMIGELLLDRDEVGLPGLGAFLAETVPASFSDKGYTINPPYRRVNFLPGRSDDDSLVLLYSSSNGIDYDQAKAILQHFLEQIRKELVESKIVLFTGLGRLRSTRQNNFFFITDEDLDIYPDGFGLPAVSLKNHTETRTEISSKVAELVAFVEGPVEEALPVVPEEETLPSVPEEEASPVVLEEVSALEPEPLPEDIQEDIIELVEEDEPAIALPEAEEPKAEAPAAASGPKRIRWWLIIPLVLIGLAVIGLATFVILAQAAPDFIDSILYTPEELRIINY